MTPKQETPLVTVLLAVYNGSEHIEDAIESIRSQEFDNYEFVIVDDGSEDGTREIIRSYDDERIRLITQENNGQAAALNRGLAAARGKFIARIDDDDTATANRLSEQAEMIANDSAIGLVGADYIRRDLQDGDVTEKTVHPPRGNGKIRASFPFRNPFAHSTVMFRREPALAVGGYDESLDSCIDYDLWVRIGAAGYRFGVVEKTLCTIRKHSRSSYQFESIERLRYRWTGTKIRLQSVYYFNLPIFCYIIPIVMLIWGIFPDRITDTLKQGLPIGTA